MLSPWMSSMPPTLFLLLLSLVLSCWIFHPACNGSEDVVDMLYFCFVLYVVSSVNAFNIHMNLSLWLNDEQYAGQ